MAEVFYFHVQEDRSIKYKLTEPIMQEDKDVAVWRFRIPKVLNNIDMSAWSWWFVYVNAKNQKFSELLTLTNDIDDPENYCTADYSIGYGISKTSGGFTFALEAINTSQGGEISGEWHTRTYTHTVTPTLQGNQAEYTETESDIISALIVEVQNKYNALVGGATPLPVALKSLMTDHDKVYLYTGSESGESTGYWYYYNGTQFVPGGQYGAGVQIDPTLSQSGQAADAKVVGDEISDLKSDYSQLPYLNVYDSSQVSSGHFLDGYGVVRDNASWVISERISLEGYSGTVSFAGISTVGLTPKNCYYDANDNFISSFSSDTGLVVLTPPVNAKYIRFSINVHDVGSFRCYLPRLLKREVIDDEFIPSIAAKKLDFTVLSKNVVPADTVWEKGYIRTSDGANASADSSYARTQGFIPVEAEETYSLSFVKSHNNIVAINLFFYSSSKEYLGYIDSIYGNRQFDTPANTAFVRVTSYKNNESVLDNLIPYHIQIEKGSTVTEYEEQLYQIPKKYIKGLQDASSLPDYYYADDYITDKVNTINSILKDHGVDGLSFIFITDMHWEQNAKNSPKLIRHLSDHCNIPMLVNGGDNTDGFNITINKALYDAFGKDRVFAISGNHEYEQNLTYSEMFYQTNVFNDKAVWGDVDRNYYYIDDTTKKVRYIVLAAYIETAEYYGNGFAYEPQYTWLVNTALNVPNGWDVVVFTHSLYVINMETDAINTPPESYQQYIDAIDASDAVICVIQGHTHRDRIVYTPNNKPVIICACDKYRIWRNGQGTADINTTRTEGTITEQYFNVFSIDRSNHTIKAISVGAQALDGIDSNVGSSVEIRTINY